MSILKVARMGHPVLRAKARPLEKSEIRSPIIQKLIDDMIDTMAEYHGVGLAAPQVHEGVRIFIAALDDGEEDEPEPEPLALINPEIEDHAKAAGFDIFLRKPLRTASLLKILSGVRL